MKFLKVFLTGIVGFGMLMFLLVMCASIEDKPSADQPKETTTSPKVAVAPSRSNKVAVAPSRPDKVDWNVKDLDAITNGNIPLAVEYIKSSNSANVGTTADAASVLKTPWKYYGKMLCFTGTVGVVEDQPEESNLSKLLGGGETSEVVIATADGSIVDLFAMESSGKLKKGETTRVCGLPVGRTEVTNAVGGKFTHLIMVGFIQ